MESASGAGFLHSRSNRNGRTLFLLHGWMATRMRIIEQALLLVDHGFHVVLLDQRSHGASGRGLMTFGEKEGRDLLAAVSQASTFPEVNPSQLGAMGFSMGIAGVVFAAALPQRPHFRCIVLEGVFANSADVGEFGLVQRLGWLVGKSVGYGVFTPGMALWSLGRFRHSEPAKVIGQIRDTPVMIIRGGSDDTVPAASAEALIAAANEPKIVWRHSRNAPLDDLGNTRSLFLFPDEYRQRVLGFLNRYLPPAAGGGRSVTTG